MKTMLTMMSELVDMALRMLFRSHKGPRELPLLPSFDAGGFLVDIDNRDALYDAMEKDACPPAPSRS